MIENLLVLFLFTVYLLLWGLKRRHIKNTTGIDPEVFKDASDPLQQYMFKSLRFLSAAIFAIIVLKILNINLYLFLTPIPQLDGIHFDLIGFIIGLFGLGICALAQMTMGNSWRVGIDDKRDTKLIITGIFRFSRNPTYLGLLILFIGVWLIWPMWAIVTYFLVFFLFINIQVRCEESYLMKKHSEQYSTYKSSVSRYIGFKGK